MIYITREAYDRLEHNEDARWCPMCGDVQVSTVKTPMGCWDCAQGMLSGAAVDALMMKGLLNIKASTGLMITRKR